MLANKVYYFLKPLIPRNLQLILRRRVVLRKILLFKEVWPIDEKAAKSPEGWTEWPDRKQFSLILTHDVDTGFGQEKCMELMMIEKELGFRSSFNFVPERYGVSTELRQCLTSHGFEVGVHGLKHDGKLYKSEKVFQDRVESINRYLKEWKAVGFRSPSMHHNLNWLHDLNIDYDSSTFDTDPFEPQADGVKTIFPFPVGSYLKKKGYIELPYTLPQDFTLYILMKEKNIDIWKRKLDWIVRCGGMALLNTHPDYMNFSKQKCRADEYPVKYYLEFLEYIRDGYKGLFWHALPKQVADLYRDQIKAGGF